MNQIETFATQNVTARVALVLAHTQVHTKSATTVLCVHNYTPSTSDATLSYVWKLSSTYDVPRWGYYVETSFRPDNYSIIMHSLR